MQNFTADAVGNLCCSSLYYWTKTFFSCWISMGDVLVAKIPMLWCRSWIGFQNEHPIKTLFGRCLSQNPDDSRNEKKNWAKISFLVLQSWHTFLPQRNFLCVFDAWWFHCVDYVLVCMKFVGVPSSILGSIHFFWNCTVGKIIDQK